MSEAFHKVIARVRNALDTKAPPREERPLRLPATASARRAELTTQFADELERVDGRFLGVLSAAQLPARIVALARELRMHSIALGEGVVLDPAPIAQALEAVGLPPIRPRTTDDDGRARFRQRMAKCDLAVVEAHYAIASSGTLAVVATPGRPGSLTLLPPANIILVDASRILPDMAAVLDALGTLTITAHRVAFITGPSRTADIEKMIVLGVHGPKQLYAAVIGNPAE